MRMIRIKKILYTFLLFGSFVAIIWITIWFLDSMLGVPFIPKYQCWTLYSEDTNRSILDAAANWGFDPNDTLSDQELYLQISQSCDNFMEKQKYFLNFTDEQNERNFRIAFTIITYKRASQVERLLRVIYRPWNYYCIHVDAKSSDQFASTILKLINCLNERYHNIIFTNNRVDVVWGTITVLTADLNCMKEIYDKYKDWKYLINLTGQEFPLKTNAEIVRILQAYKGANNIDGTYKYRRENRLPKIKMQFPVIWIRGSTHITANRQFIGFMFESNISKSILDAIKDRRFPDEQFYNTLNYNPQFRIPGSFIGSPDEFVPANYTRKNFMTRFKNWGEYSCKSEKIVREICIWGVGDLPKLVSAPHLFSNKFYENFQPATLKCLEQWYYNKVEREIKTGRIEINSTFYSSLPFVQYQYMPGVS